jgi:transposase
LRALTAWSDSRTGKPKRKRVGFPRIKKNASGAVSFRLRNKHKQGRPSAIRVGDNNRSRLVTLRNHRLEFARRLGYKQGWHACQLVLADRWYPSSKLCPQCGAIQGDLTLADGLFACSCGYSADRDADAASNLDPRTSSTRAGPPMPADRTALTSTHVCR